MKFKKKRMKYTSKKTLHSKLEGYEDVAFTLKKMAEGRRVALNMSLADAKATLRDLIAESQTILPDTPEGQVAPPIDPAQFAKYQTLSDRINTLVEKDINMAWLRWGLDSITGLEIDGQPCTVETLISDGPPELFAEILTAIRSEAELSTEARKN